MLVGKEGSIDYFCEYKYCLQMMGTGMKRNNPLDWFLRYDFLLVLEVKKMLQTGSVRENKNGPDRKFFFCSEKPCPGNKNGPDRPCPEEFGLSRTNQNS